MNTMKELKCFLKELAVEIRTKKNTRKEVLYGYVLGLDDLRNNYRNHHIAYCVLRGTSIEKIEHNTDYINAAWDWHINPIIKSISFEKTKEVENAA